MPRSTIVVLLCLAGCGGGAEYSWRESAGSVALTSQGQTVWEFQYGPELAKPMFHPVSLTDGAVLTWDAPPDHPWHHAFWFCWKYLNGVNYWEEDPQTGRSDGVTSWSNVQAQTHPDGSARISMDLLYHPDGEPAVLEERREIDVSAPDENGTYHFDWEMTFTAIADEVSIDRTPISGEPDGKAWGGYAGLSVRFAKEFGEWRAVSSDGEVERDTSVAFHAEKGPLALDFSGVVAGREAGIALLDHPANLNAPTPWYIVMNQEKWFGFSEAAVIYYTPHRLRAGEQLTLRYRAVVHEGRWEAARLRTEQNKYVREINHAE